MQIKKTDNISNFGARIVISKRNRLNQLTKSLSNDLDSYDTTVIGSSAGLSTIASGSQTIASGAGLNLSAQTPQSNSIPLSAAKCMPEALWQHMQPHFITPQIGNENATVSAYSSALGTFIQVVTKKIFDFCEYIPRKRNFPS
jgi:hypothetical protein